MYWSNSKFADWLRGVPKPHSATCEEWDQWRKLAKKNPIRFFLAETALDYIEDWVKAPFQTLHSAKYWFVNRFITRTHALTSTLERGKWHEFDQRLLYSMFDELVNFVEQELAWQQIAWDREARAKYNAPWNAVGWFRMRTWRSRAAGMAHLDWASELKHDETFLGPGHPLIGTPTPQAVGSREIRELYLWWTETRPKRPDPHDESGWIDYCATHPFSLGKESDEDRQRVREMLDHVNNVETFYFDEDTKMMERLIRIRGYMWT